MLRIERLLKIQVIFLLCFALSIFAQTEADASPAAVVDPPSATAAAAASVVIDGDSPAVEEAAAEAPVEDVVSVEETVEDAVSVEKKVVEAPAVEDAVSVEKAAEVPVVEDAVPPVERVVETPAPTIDDIAPSGRRTFGSPVEPAAPVPAAAVAAVPVEVPVEDSASFSVPKIGVYVTGDLDAIETRALSTYILDALVRSGRYIAIERSEEFLAQIDKEHIRQRSGAIDDEQIISLGKQSGVQFICVADVTKAFGSNQVSVRILDVETATVVAVGVTEGRLRTINDLREIASAVIDVMFDVAPSLGKRVRLGGRLAYNNSYAGGLSYIVRTYDQETSIRSDTEHKNELGMGSGFEVGGVIAIRVAGKMSVETGANLVWRNPVNIGGVVNISEFAITVPALLRYNIGASPYYAQGGWQIEIPFMAREKMEGEKATEFNERSSADVGFILGGGRRFGKSLSADLRIIGGAISFDGQPNHQMFQAALGASLMF